MLLASYSHFCSSVLQGGKGKCAPFWKGIKILSGVFKARDIYWWVSSDCIQIQIYRAQTGFFAHSKKKKKCLFKAKKTLMLFTKMHDLVKSFLSFSFGLFCHEGKPWIWGSTPCKFCPRVVTWLYFNVPGWSWKSRLLSLSKHRFLGSSPKVLHYRVWNLGICIFNKFPVWLIRTEKHLEAKILTP